MKRLDDTLERLFWRVGRQSGRVVAVLAFLAYGGIGLALPLSLGWPISWLVTANLLGTTCAGLFVAAWIAVGVQARYRRQLIEWTTDLRNLDAAEFEWFVGEVFRREGWKVEEVGGRGYPDGNVDLRLARGSQRVVVQCKRWTAWQVGVDDIRAFGGTLMKEGRAGTDGVFVTLSDFTDAARLEAKQIGLSLVDNRELHSRVEKIRAPEPCDICSAPMVLDRSRRGWWFRCVAPGCAGKRDLGNEPARAVELLLQAP